MLLFPFQFLEYAETQILVVIFAGWIKIDFGKLYY